MPPFRIIMTLKLVKATPGIVSTLSSLLLCTSLRRSTALREKYIEDPAKIMGKKIGSIYYTFKPVYFERAWCQWWFCLSNCMEAKERFMLMVVFCLLFSNCSLWKDNQMRKLCGRVDWGYGSWTHSLNDVVQLPFTWFPCNYRSSWNTLLGLGTKHPYLKAKNIRPDF